MVLRVGIVGAGHFGTQHARIYSQAENARVVAVCDIDPSTGMALAEQYGAGFSSDYRSLIGKVDAVSLAVPTIDHCNIACDLLEAGIAVLVEKPIARTVDEADEIVKTATRTGSVLQVGHLERFNPAVLAAERIVTTPRFFEAHRLSVFTARSLDIDVVTDLMIHDIDVVLSLVDSNVSEIRAAGMPILSPRIDIANARIEFENGCIANLTASRVSSEKVRKLRFFQPGEYVSIDYSSQEVQRVGISHDDNDKPVFVNSKLPVARDEPLRLEIESFLAAARGAPVKTGGEQARCALAVAVQITKEVRKHADRAGVGLVSEENE